MIQKSKIERQSMKIKLLIIVMLSNFIYASENLTSRQQKTRELQSLIGQIVEENNNIDLLNTIHQNFIEIIENYTPHFIQLPNGTSADTNLSRLEYLFEMLLGSNKYCSDYERNILENVLKEIVVKLALKKSKGAIKYIQKNNIQLTEEQRKEIVDII